MNTRIAVDFARYVKVCYATKRQLETVDTHVVDSGSTAY